MEGFAVLLGGIITILTTIAVEALRKPKLRLSITDAADNTYQGHPAQEGRFLYLRLTNKPLPRWARWMSRSAALQCHGEITFHHQDGQNVFGRAMPIRWSDAPEPVMPRILIEGKQFGFFDPNLMALISRRDIYPGESERLDVAVKFDQDGECYGWTNGSYFSTPKWRNPDWKLPPARYLVHLTVVCGGDRCSGLYRLVADVARKDFRVEEAMPGDSARP